MEYEISFLSWDSRYFWSGALKIIPPCLYLLSSEEKAFILTYSVRNMPAKLIENPDTVAKTSSKVN